VTTPNIFCTLKNVCITYHSKIPLFEQQLDASLTLLTSQWRKCCGQNSG